MQDYLYTTNDAKSIDKIAIKELVSKSYELMERAGKACFAKIFEIWPKTFKFLIFVGTGNNGGDGIVVAKLALEHNFQVELIQVGNEKKISSTSKTALKELKKLNNKNIKYKKLSELKPNDYLNDESLVIVDALLGIGIQDKPKDDFEQAILQINNLKKLNKKIKVFSVDIPSGLNGDTGFVEDELAVKADATLSLICLKKGLFTGFAKEYTGNVFIYDLEIFSELKDEVTSNARLITENNVNNLTKIIKREQFKSKHDFGHVVILGGEYGMGGATLLSGMAALRAGAGLVTVATHPSNAELIFLKQPELMTFGIDFNLFSENFSDNDSNFESENRLASLLDKADAIVLGPGLGQGAFGKRLWGFIKNYKSRPIVIDADALNWLAKEKDKKDLARENWILTPHPGEAGRLLGCDSSEIQKNRFKSISEITSIYNGTCVLKGSGSIISTKTNSMKSLDFVCPYGNPGMASAGMGDVLSGVIGALVANGLNTEEAAIFGVFAHSKAADNIANAHHQKGLLASDIIEEIRNIVNQFSE